MSLNPFAAVEDYPGMLNKIAWYNLFAGVWCTSMLYNHIPDIHSALSSKLTVDILGNQLSLLVVLIPFGLAVFCRIIKLHDRISDAFGIRKRYDIQHILIPMLDKVGIPVDQRLNGISKKKRNSL